MKVELELRAWNRIVRTLRKRSGLTQEQAVATAKAAGVKLTISAWSGWEQERTTPKLNLLWPALRALGYEPEEIFEAWFAARDELNEELTEAEDGIDLASLIRRRVSVDPGVAREVARAISEIGNDSARADFEDRLASALSELKTGEEAD